VKQIDRARQRHAGQSLSARHRRPRSRRAGNLQRPDLSSSEVVSVAMVTRRILSVAVELTLMLPHSILEEFVERVIERLDAQAGDPDCEPTDEREAEEFI
jgi:hypothetical protein